MSQTNQEHTLGYYAVVNCERTGWTGGLLILSSSGRPLEFRCTLPVRPSKSHEILFGATMRSHLIGEVIGSLLLKTCRTPISMICCQQPEAIALETHANCPVCLVRDAAEDDEGPIDEDTLAGSVGVELAGSTMSVPMEHSERVQEICEGLQNLPDATEPFERIREAIREAHSQLARAA